MFNQALTKAPSTLSRFQTKTKVFCSVFEKILVHIYRFRIAFARVRFENAFIPSVRILKWTRRMRISIYRPAKLAPFLILCCWVLFWFRILWYFPSKRCQEQLESNQNLKQTKIPRFLLVKSTWRLSWVKCACKIVKDLTSCRSREKPHGSVCPPFWILTVEWSGAPVVSIWWRHRFPIASLSPSTLENTVFKGIVFKLLHSGERCRMAPFSVIVFVSAL